MSGDPSLGVYAALRRYSNVHRGTGHHSILSTELFERARGIVREHVNAGPDHVVLLVTPWKLDGLLGSLKPQTAVQVVSSAELGLAVGVRAVVVRRADLPTGIPPQTGGGTIKMVSRDFISWADAPDRFEPGTPNIIGTIALARALRVPTEAGPQDPATARSAEDILYRDGLGDRSGAALLTALQETLIGRDAVVATTLGERRYVNLDNGASTPTFEPVWDAFRWTLEADPAVQADVVREAASRCHAFFGAPEADYDLLFASNTTEAVNIAMQNLVRTAEEQPGTVVMNTWMEHNSNELPWRHSGVEQVRVPVDRDGQIDLEEMERMLAAYNISHAHGDRRIRLVSVCGASNVMGTYADIPAIGRLVRNYDAQLMVDAAQLSAHRPIDMARDGVDFLAFSAHKMYAPFGSGGLVARRDRLRLDDETLERIRQSGAENAAGVAAVGKAVELLERIGFDTLIHHETEMTRRALRGMSEIPSLKIYGIQDPDHPAFDTKGGVICFEFDHLPHNRVARQLAEAGGIGVRSGCFCVNMYVKEQLGIGWSQDMVAHVGLTTVPSLMEPLLVGLVRVSLGVPNTEEDVDWLLDVLRQISEEPSSWMERWLAWAHLGAFDAGPTDVSRWIEDAVRSLEDEVFGTESAVVTEAAQSQL